MRRVSRQYIKNWPFFFKFAAVMACIAFILDLTFAYKFIRELYERRPVKESAKTEMKKIPPEIKEQFLPSTPSATLRIPILMYHYVENIRDQRDTIRRSLNISPLIFEDQIKTLSENGYTFMTAKELGDVLIGKNKVPSKPILITIDDGHWDVDTVILPILKKYHIKATAYIITDFIGGSDFLSEDQLRDIIKSGIIEIGAHTVHHVSLKNKLTSTVEHEVKESKKDLEDNYHIPVYSFAYPNGAFDLQAIQVVRDAGFETAMSTLPGKDVSFEHRFFLTRLRPGARTGQYLLDWLQK